MRARVDDPKTSFYIERHCTGGIKEQYKLKLNRTDADLTFSDWQAEIQADMTRCGLATVFIVVDDLGTPTTEVDLLEDLSAASDMRAVSNWVKKLHANADPYDIDNLEWSETFIKNSIDEELLRQAQQLLPNRTRNSGPEWWAAVVKKVVNINHTTMRAAINRLTQMQLSQEPGHNVSTFVPRIRSLLREIVSANATTPQDLAVIVATCMHLDQPSLYGTMVSQLFNEASELGSTLNPDDILTRLLDHYNNLVICGQWPAAESTRQQRAGQQSIAMTGQQLQIQGGTTGPCARCGRPGHVRRKLPHPVGAHPIWWARARWRPRRWPWSWSWSWRSWQTWWPWRTRWWSASASSYTSPSSISGSSRPQQSRASGSWSV